MSAEPRSRSEDSERSASQQSVGDGDVYVTGAGEPVARPTAGAPGRSSAQIRADIELQRRELSRSVKALRGRMAELTDWRRQVREHRRELIAGAAIVGFAVGGLLALRRSRNASR